MIGLIPVRQRFIGFYVTRTIGGSMTAFSTKKNSSTLLSICSSLTQTTIGSKTPSNGGTRELLCRTFKFRFVDVSFSYSQVFSAIPAITTTLTSPSSDLSVLLAQRRARRNQQMAE